MFQFTGRLAALVAVVIILSGCASVRTRSRSAPGGVFESSGGTIVLEPEPSLSMEAPLVTEPIPTVTRQTVTVSSTKATTPGNAVMKPVSKSSKTPAPVSKAAKPAAKPAAKKGRK